MCDDISPLRMQKKTRSASICATSGGSMETTIYSMPLAATSGGASGSATPESGGTPGYRRRRPATRSQSARITTGARSVRRRQQVTHPQQMQQHNLQESRSYCNSEPRLSETETPPQRRKLSQRRPQTHGQRKSNAFLDVPTGNMHHLRVSGDDDEDLDRLRTFNTSKGGLINRGDSFRRRRSRSNSLAPASPVHPTRATANGGASSSAIDSISSHGYYNHYQQNHQQSHHQQQRQQQQQQQQVEVFHVEMLGSPGVGKQALISQFRTSDCINAYDGPECDEDEQNISIILDGIESELKFSTGKHDNKLSSFLKLQDELVKADAFLVVYSCVDKESYTRAKQILSRLQDMDLLRTRPCILVANKIDLARSRSVSAQDGKCLACTFGAKFIEVSVGINHNCDELLAGTLTQIRLKKDQNLLQRTKKRKDKSTKHIDCKDKIDLTATGTDRDDQHEHQDTDKCLNDKNTANLGDIDDSPQSAHWYKSRSVVLASMKARQMLTWILGKEDAKFKHCENLQVL